MKKGHISDLECPRNGISPKVQNSFSCFPNTNASAYNNIKYNIQNWIEKAISGSNEKKKVLY